MRLDLLRGDSVATEIYLPMPAKTTPKPRSEPPLAPCSDVPAVTHVDYSARVQTVHRETNPRYHALLEAFKARTGCPVIVNTSFNVRGEAIVCTPADAFRCFMGTALECLAIGNCFLPKEEQDMSLKRVRGFVRAGLMGGAVVSTHRNDEVYGQPTGKGEQRTGCLPREHTA